MKCTENGVFCGSGQQQINYSVPLGVANAATSIRVELQASGYSAGCGEFSGIDQGATEYGNLTLQFNIDNQWGANLPRTMVTPGATDFRLTSHVQNEVPYDNSDWKGQLWWSVLLAEDNHVIKAFSADGAHETFSIWILPGRARCCLKKPAGVGLTSWRDSAHRIRSSWVRPTRHEAIPSRLVPSSPPDAAQTASRHQQQDDRRGP